MDPAELDARWSQWSRGVHGSSADEGQENSDFRSYLANLEQEIRGREAAMDAQSQLPEPSVFASEYAAYAPDIAPIVAGAPVSDIEVTRSQSGNVFAAKAFAEAEDVMR